MEVNKSAAPTRSILLYYGQVSGFSILVVLLLLVLKWIERGYIDPFNDMPVADRSYIPSPALYLVSIPFGFAFWLYALRETYIFPLRFSFLALALSVLCLFGATTLDSNDYESVVVVLSIFSTLSALFIRIGFFEFCNIAFKDLYQSYIGLVAIFSSTFYALIDNVFWLKMCHSATMASGWVLKTLGYSVNYGVQSSAITIASSNFIIVVHRGCSGLEGIFLFMFLLSLVLLVDWKLLKKIDFIETYLIGFIFMYMVNVFRIVSLFLLGHYANAPDASPFVASLKGLPLHVFHSFAGQIYYILAFMLFAGILYRYALRLSAKEKQ